MFSISLTMSEPDRTLDNERRKRFLAYYKLRYRDDDDRARFIRDAQITKGRASQYFDESYPFGEKAARNLAVKLDLPEDAFLHDPDACMGYRRSSRPSSLTIQWPRAFGRGRQ